MTFKTIKNFTFDYNKKLGEGSTGTVYLGTDLRNNQSIAVKAIELKNIDN
jgi:serine/threonine protein kinase